MFERTSEGWRETATLIPAHGTANDVFGQAVALKNGTALIGAPLDDHPDGEPTDAAFIFKRTSDGWTEAAKLTAANGDRDDYFGASVALTGDTARNGAEYDDDPNRERAGAAYVFKRGHRGWTQTTKLTPAGGDARDVFGGSVTLTDADDAALIGAPSFGVNGTEESGMAYVFERNTTGWSEAAKLTPADIDGGDEFGFSVTLADSTLLVTAHQDADPNGTEAGAAYVVDL